MPVSLAQRLQGASQPKVIPQSIPVSVTGLNTRDAVTAMAPTDAIILDNWYPDAGGLTVRNGSKPFVTGLGATYVNTLAQFSALGVRKFIAACEDKIWDISTGSAVSVGTGYSSSIWQTANFNNYLFLVNGTESQRYDGSTIGDAGFTISAAPASNFAGICVFKNRIFLWKANDNAFYYGALNAITGAVTRFPLSMVSQSGGDLVAMTTMSYDGGAGVQDMVVFILSSGETIIYTGNDPGDATNWFLVGRFKISPPVNVRAVARYGAESYLTTNDDHVPLTQQLVANKLGQIPPRSKISGAVQAATKANPDAFGWEAFFYPAGRRLIFNVPNVDATFSQHVYNVSTDAWCTFSGLQAATWGLYNNLLYFGGATGTVWQADVGTTDNGTAISADGQPAWNDFGDVRRKRLSAIRPVLQAISGVSYQYGTAFDYQDVGLLNTSSTIISSGSPWDTSVWDVAAWSPENITSAKWKLVGGTGTALGVRVRSATTAGLSWLRTDVRYEIGRDI